MYGLSESEGSSGEVLASSDCPLASSTGSLGARNNDHEDGGNTRSRARAAGKPERYRQAADTGPATRDPAKLKKKSCTAGNQKKSAPKVASPPSKGTNVSNPSPKNGAWSEVESAQFKDGCVAYGWGNWASIERCVPTRNRNQVKSHAQKFQKHHPGERERLQAEFERQQKSQAQRVLGKKKARASNDAKTPAETKKRKLQRSPSSHSDPKEKSRKRSDPSALDRVEEPVKVSKRAPPVKEVKSTDKSLTVHPPKTKGSGTSGVSVLNTKKHAPPEGKSSPTKKKRAATIDIETPGTGAWTEEEQKQFEDAVCVHGWGNWIDVETCIPTRTNSQVKSHAQKYQKHKPLRKEQLDLDHHLYGKKGGAIAGKANARNGEKLVAKRPSQTKNLKVVKSPTDKNPACVTSLERLKMGHKQHNLAKVKESVCGAKVNHILLDGGGTKGSVSAMKLEEAPSAKSRQKTTADDYGAAKAIMALNSAGWDANLDNKSKAVSWGLKQIVLSEHGDSWEGSYNVREEAMPSLDKYRMKKSAIVASSEEETSQDADDGSTLESVHKSDEDANSEIDHGESKPSQGLNCCESTSSLPSISTDLREEAPVVTRASSSRLKGLKDSSQPPPHWLAADSWGECMDNIYRWNNQLTKKEQDLERLKYDKFTDGEKERMRKKLVDLMENQP